MHSTIISCPSQGKLAPWEQHAFHSMHATSQCNATTQRRYVLHGEGVHNHTKRAWKEVGCGRSLCVILLLLYTLDKKITLCNSDQTLLVLVKVTLERLSFFLSPWQKSGWSVWEITESRHFDSEQGADISTRIMWATREARQELLPRQCKCERKTLSQDSLWKPLDKH